MATDPVNRYQVPVPYWTVSGNLNKKGPEKSPTFFKKNIYFSYILRMWDLGKLKLAAGYWYLITSRAYLQTLLITKTKCEGVCLNQP
jgi:hypothetical protein